jgi:hypothetical protein
MRKIAFLLIFGNIIFGAASLHAQIVNGSFSDGLTGWTSLGNPAVVTDNPSLSSTTAAQVQSTNNSGDAGSGPLNTADSVSVTDIDTALSTTLPSVDGKTPTVGEGLYQSFTLGGAATLSFHTSYATFDSSPLDSAGYVLDGTYTQLYATPNLSQPTPSAYQNYTIPLSAGSHTIAFVAYNTFDEGYTTSLFITDVSIIPEPATWLLLALGLGGLVAAIRLKPRAV